MSGVPDEKDLRLAREAEGYYELQLYEDALERAEKLLSVDALADRALGMKAECLRSLERWEEGAAAFEELIGRERDNVGAYVGLGWCLKRSSRLDLALEAMERLLEARPDEGIGLYNLACYCSLAGDRERAIRLLDRAVIAEEEFRDHAKTEEDFDPVRQDPEFRKIVGGEE